ncbi:diacylglycerol kinase family protein [Kroppenstedtia pulmonis]|uniref:Diacylglycerol kinase family protein n=1 Tax=Kroppenstedtia pulmonis TaxID=1380685 RepID=A0A7D4CNN7_9BACL|nr:diacylglycerol kinase family protein [Kroppenstedtia pulmonis]QKG84938.1 diacylglycerol kinase family protein [Kroppenstedtia pulmonis]
MWLNKLLSSFRFALEGLRYTWVSQRNMRIHFIAALAVLLLSFFLSLSKLEMLLIFLCIVIVLMAELFNTAVEAVVDMVTKEFHPLAKIAKDVAAGAVLLSAGMAVIVGISIFYPYLMVLSLESFGKVSHPPNMGMAALIAFNFFFTLAVKGFFHSRRIHDWEPSMTTSLASCIATTLVLMIGNLLVTLLILLLTGLLLGTKMRITMKKGPVILGALLGMVVALIGFQVM